MDTKIIITTIVATLVLLIGGAYFVSSSQTQASPEMTTFAQCIADSGATFYGAFWCSHCQEQKQMFASAESELPYTECSTPDGNSMTQACRAAGVESYPTWEFSDGSRLTGVQSLETLAQKTNCEKP